MKGLLEKHKKNIAVVSDKGDTYTYADVLVDITSLNTNINQRSLVFNLCSNTYGSYIGYLTCLSEKSVALQLDALILEDKLLNLIKVYCPDYIWLPTQRAAELQLGDIIYEALDYALIKVEKNEKTILNDDLALLLTTSGSTGSPKLVRLSYSNVLANANSIAQYLNLNSDERPVTALPMSYSFGLSIINSHIVVGATLLLTEFSIIQKEFWSFLKENKATSLSGVPYSFEMLHRLRFYKMELPNLKTITQAGGKLSKKLCETFFNHTTEKNINFFVMYGQTEATARMSYNLLNHSKNITSIGKAIPGGYFDLLDGDGNTVNEGETGELVYSGDNVSLGYALDKSDLYKSDDNHGKLYTGDLATMDNEGNYYIVGRKKRFIKLFGNRVNLDECEQILSELIDSCACVGQDEKLIVYITEENKLDTVKQFLMKHIKINHRALEVRYISEIPKNTAGKKLYAKLPSE